MKPHIAPLRGLVAAVLLAALASSSLFAQGGARITVVEGQGADLSIDMSVAAPIIVELRDGSGAPIPRAEVIFKSPSDGPSATFFGASYVSKAWTDDNGRAESAALTPNKIAGPYTILVQAEHQGATASAEVQQTNVGPPAPEKKKRRIGPKIWVPIAAGVALVIVGLAQRD
jgi:hypothetical protein